MMRLVTAGCILTVFLCAESEGQTVSGVDISAVVDFTAPERLFLLFPSWILRSPSFLIMADVSLNGVAV